MSATASVLDEPRITSLGSTALLFEAPGSFDIEHQRRIWALADFASVLDGVAEAVPGMTNLMIVLTEPVEDLDRFSERLLAAWATGAEKHVEATVLTVPILYGGDGGPHLRDVAEGTGLSIEEVVRIHTAPDYTVYAVGSHAGYCYLGGLDRRLFMPRRKVPLVSIPGGSLSVAGMQTGMSASAGPSGWHTIGRGEVRFFDPERRPPALLKPGDIIRFVAERIVE